MLRKFFNRDKGFRLLFVNWQSECCILITVSVCVLDSSLNAQSYFFFLNVLMQLWSSVPSPKGVCIYDLEQGWLTKEKCDIIGKELWCTTALLHLCLYIFKLGPKFSFFVIKFFIFVVSSFQNIRPHFFTTSLTSLTQIAIIQPKNLTKTIQIFTMVIVF